MIRMHGCAQEVSLASQVTNRAIHTATLMMTPIDCCCVVSLQYNDTLATQLIMINWHERQRKQVSSQVSATESKSGAVFGPDIDFVGLQTDWEQWRAI